MLNVGKIEEGFVLDHIKAGMSLSIYHHLQLDKLDCTVAIIKNARSNKMTAKQGFERMMLDAIYNDGDIQEIHKVMGKPVKRWLLEFSNVFTLNYDNNIEDLIKRPVFHLHGEIGRASCRERV